MNRTSLIVAVVFFAAGIVVGMALMGPGGAVNSNASAAPNPSAFYCQDALARRAQAEQALSMPSSDPGARIMARQEARVAYERAVADISRYCPPPR